MTSSNFKVLSSSSQGKVYLCGSCDKIHIEFKNLSFSFNRKEYNQFINYFLKLEPNRWEYLNQDTIYTRKIQVPIAHKNLTLMFCANEIYQLQELFKNVTKSKVSIELISRKRFSAQLALN